MTVLRSSCRRPFSFVPVATVYCLAWVFGGNPMLESVRLFLLREAARFEALSERCSSVERARSYRARAQAIRDEVARFEGKLV